MEKAPSAGKTTFIGVSGGTSGVVLLLYIVHKCGIDDMTPEVAAAIITLAGGIAGAVMHVFQRTEEKKEAKDEAATNGVMGGPEAAH